MDLARLPPALTSVLSSDERTRAARILDGTRRELWARSRAALRLLLAGQLGREPETIEFEHARGRPRLRSNGPAPLCFGVSHSGAAALYAFGANGPVAVDLEMRRRPLRNELQLARRAFGEGVAAQIAQLDGEARAHEFLRRWVRREAELKCRGEGIWGALASAGPQRPAGAEVWVSDLPSPSNGAFAAVAADTRPTGVRYGQWDAASGVPQKIFTTSFCV